MADFTAESAVPLIGMVGRRVALASANFTRPADTNAYTAGDLIANSTTAASVTPMQLAVAALNAGTGSIRRARLSKSGTGVSNATFRVHLYSSDPSASSGIAN